MDVFVEDFFFDAEAILLEIYKFAFRYKHIINKISHLRENIILRFQLTSLDVQQYFLKFSWHRFLRIVSPRKPKKKNRTKQNKPPRDWHFLEKA